MLEEAVSTLYRDVQGREQHLSVPQGIAWTFSGSLAEGGLLFSQCRPSSPILSRGKGPGQRQRRERTTHSADKPKLLTVRRGGSRCGNACWFAGSSDRSAEPRRILMLAFAAGHRARCRLECSLTRQEGSVSSLLFWCEHRDLRIGPLAHRRRETGVWAPVLSEMGALHPHPLGLLPGDVGFHPTHPAGPRRGRLPRRGAGNVSRRWRIDHHGPRQPIYDHHRVRDLPHRGDLVYCCTKEAPAAATAIDQILAASLTEFELKKLSFKLPSDEPCAIDALRVRACSCHMCE